MRTSTILLAACGLVIAGLAVSCGGSQKKAAAKAAEEAAEQARQDSIAKTEMIQKQESAMEKVKMLPDEPVFDIITNYGTIKVKLYSKTPKHRENFAKLALSGYYDGLLFHRVIKGFMLQTGDPYTRDTSRVADYGKGGPDYTIPAEFVPEYKHKKGALAAARRGDAANPMKESSGSQFYIVQDAAGCSHLDGAYTVFGETLEGFDVIDKIAAVETNSRDLPLQEVRIIAVKSEDLEQ
jgi:cyclophilin family peptidyl-prolyl cis-trans isomerase